jgi:F-type H+-transporting ATPase subunit b
MLELLQEKTSIWHAFSFVIFVAILIKFALGPILRTLDSRIEEIKREIETANRLKDEAAALVQEYQQKQRDSEKIAADIIARARESAEEIRKNAEDEFAETMERREIHLLERIKRIEENAIADIQNHAADLAMQATREIVMKSLDDQADIRLIDQSIKTVAKNLN